METLTDLTGKTFKFEGRFYNVKGPSDGDDKWSVSLPGRPPHAVIKGEQIRTLLSNPYICYYRASLAQDGIIYRNGWAIPTKHINVYPNGIRHFGPLEFKLKMSQDAEFCKYWSNQK